MWELWESVGLKMFWTHHLEEFEWLGWRLWHLWDDLALKDALETKFVFSCVSIIIIYAYMCINLNATNVINYVDQRQYAKVRLTIQYVLS